MSEPENAQNRREIITGQFIQQQQDGSKGVPSSGVAPLDPDRDSAGCYLNYFSKRAMACDFQIFLEWTAARDLSSSAMNAFAEIDRIEEQLSVYRDSSELSELNRSAVGTPRVLSFELFELLKVAREINEVTRGAFDISQTPLSRIWGFYSRQPAFPGSETIAQSLNHVGPQHWVLMEQTQSATRLIPEVELNLNCLGKGYALDRAGSVLARDGIERFIIHGGQSSVVSRVGEGAKSGWKVALTHPFTPNERLAEIELFNESLSTSGTARQALFHSGQRYGHILDPRTGWPPSQCVSTTVLHPSAMMSDALSTAFFVMSAKEVEEFCAAHLETQAIIMRPHSQHQGSFSVETYNLNERRVDWFDPMALARQNAPESA